MPKEGFGARMTDYDGRPLRVYALYHARYETPALEERTGPFYWNFLEMHFDPAAPAPFTRLALRNVVDAPGERPRGGEALTLPATGTGRPATAYVPALSLIPDADVQISRLTGEPLRGARTEADGALPAIPLVDVRAGTPVLVTAYSQTDAVSRIVQTVSPAGG